MVLVCISLKTSEFGHLSVHLLVICMSFLKRYLFKALTYFLVFFFFFFFTIELQEFLICFEINPLSGI